MSTIFAGTFDAEWFQKNPNIHPVLSIPEIIAKEKTNPIVNKNGRTYFSVSCHQNLTVLQRVARLITAFALTIFTALIGLFFQGVRNLWVESVSGKLEIEVLFDKEAKTNKPFYADILSSSKNNPIRKNLSSFLEKITLYKEDPDLKNLLLTSEARKEIINENEPSLQQSHVDFFLKKIWLRVIEDRTKGINQESIKENQKCLENDIKIMLKRKPRFLLKYIKDLEEKEGKFIEFTSHMKKISDDDSIRDFQQFDSLITEFRDTIKVLRDKVKENVNNPFLPADLVKSIQKLN